MLAKEDIVIENKGIKLAKMMIESKLQTQKEVLWAYENDPSIKEAIAKLKKRNAQRGTPIIA
jgi:hypothetical protein